MKYHVVSVVAQRKCSLFLLLFAQDTEQTLSSVDEDRKMYLQVEILMTTLLCTLSLLAFERKLETLRVAGLY